MDEPLITDILSVGTRAITGQADKNADVIRGSDYESLLGPAAIIWVREDRRDQDLFDIGKFHTAKNDDLTYLVKQRYGIDRFLDSHGQGTATLSRASTSAGTGTVWAGTRITIFGGDPKYYRVTADTAVGAGDLLATLPIEAVITGPGVKANETQNIRIDDPVWDTSWIVASLICDDGTVFEQASDLIARVRQTRLNQRVGQIQAIKDVCASVGATKVLPFRSDYGPLDSGLNVVYVGDGAFQGTDAMAAACFIALRKARVLGDHMQVLKMARVIINPVIDIYLATAPALNDIERLQQIHRNSLIQYLGGTSGGFAFTRIGMLGAIAKPTPEVQHVNVIDPASDVGVLVGNNFPAVLNRYVVGNVSLRYFGP